MFPIKIVLLLIAQVSLIVQAALIARAALIVLIARITQTAQIKLNKTTIKIEDTKY